MGLSIAEYEAIGLCIAVEAMDDFVNHALLELREVHSMPGQSEVYFRTRDHQQLFLIRMLDFVKEGGDGSLTGVKGSCLDVLNAACTNKAFDQVGSVDTLQSAVKSVRDWLDAEKPMRFWLPSLNIDAALTVPRRKYLYVIGNQSKHNLARLTRVSEQLAELLNGHGYRTSVSESLLALDELREHLQDDYFVYYCTWITELLNNVRWGIQRYLRPCFEQAYRSDPSDSVRYSYVYPPSITDDTARAWFWRLMNNIRSRPPLKQFVGAEYLKTDKHP